jgi:peptidoglycan/xylan/chitin deacetylase (PgdA/CDA1 family)
VIRLDATAAPRTAAARWALEVLVDLSALLRVDDPGGDVVTLRVPERADAVGSVAAARMAGWGVAVGDGEVTVDEGVLSLVARIASAADEQRSTRADRHGRVPSADNQLVRERLEGEPVLHEAARSLRDAVAQAAGRRTVRVLAPWPGGRRWAAAVTHDVDVVAAWPAFAALRWAELLRRRHVGLAVRAMIAAAAATRGRPVRAGVQRILQIEASHGFEATWFVLCGTPTLTTVRQGDLTYRPEGRGARSVLGAITEAGHEVGLHGSFASWQDASVFAEQRARLSRLAGLDVTGVRQHFLRMRPGATQRAMQAAGFTYDATFGFPDRNGFRLGAADVLPGFVDHAAGITLPLDVVPLVWMDRALSKYSRIEDPAIWIEEALRLASACRAVDGLWTGLWHPNLTDALGYPGAPRAFERLIRELAASGPFMAPLREIVAWRTARRAVRVSALSPDGARVEFSGAADHRLRVERPDGRLDDALSAALVAAVGPSR